MLQDEEQRKYTLMLVLDLYVSSTTQTPLLPLTEEKISSESHTFSTICGLLA